MLAQIAHQVQCIEKYLKTDAKTLAPELASRLCDMIALLKLTYQNFSNGRIATKLAPKHVAEILIKVYWKIEVLKLLNTQSDDTSYTQLLNTMYHWIKKETYMHFVLFHAENKEGIQIILPINQKYDIRNGIGKCGGYFEKWTHDMYLYNQNLLTNHEPKPEEKTTSNVLNKMPYYGIKHSHFPQPLTNKALPNLLHTVPITSEICDLQSSQFKLFSKKNPGYKNKVIRSFRYISSAKKLGDELIDYADNYMNHVIHIYLTQTVVIAHILGLIKTNDHYYHFFDANNGWYRFRHANDFKEWFPAYFHFNYNSTINYNYIISSIQISPPPKHINQITMSLQQKPSFLRVFANHPASLVLRYKLKLFSHTNNMLKQRYQVRSALLAEKKQIFEQINHAISKEVNAHTSEFYKSQLWYSDDMQLEMKKFSRHNYEIDDMALLPRFFSERKPLDLTSQQRSPFDRAHQKCK